jgi:hypothetical protein
MSLDIRPVKVVFADHRLKDAYDKVKKADPILFKFLDRATDEIKQNPKCGIDIPKRLIPKVYVQKYGINNLWKYNLPNGWRLIYSITSDGIEIIAILLEWFSHKGYEKRFKYKIS